METQKNNLIVPEVLSRMLKRKMGQKICLLPLAKVDNSLKGRPGDTLAFPCFKQIGKAQKVDENAETPLSLLSADTVRATIEKFAHGVCLTDEALLCGFGDPLTEAVEQLSQSIDLALEEEMYKKLEDVAFVRKHFSFGITGDSIADALSLFEENLDGDKVLLLDPLAFSKLRKDSGYIKASDIGQKMILEGTVGSIWGCQIYVSNRLKGKNKAYIVKPGALRLISKSDTKLDVEREAAFMRTKLYASRHCACYLYDESRVIELNLLKEPDKFLRGDFEIEKQSEQISIKPLKMPAFGFSYVYKLSKNAGEDFSKLSGFSPLPEEAIPVQENSHIHIALVKDDVCYVQHSRKL